MHVTCCLMVWSSFTFNEVIAKPMTFNFNNNWKRSGTLLTEMHSVCTHIILCTVTQTPIPHSLPHTHFNYIHSLHTKSIDSEIYSKQNIRPKLFKKMYTTQMSIRLSLGCRKSAELTMVDISHPFHPVQCCVCSHLVARSGALSLSHYHVTQGFSNKGWKVMGGALELLLTFYLET